MDEITITLQPNELYHAVINDHQFGDIATMGAPDQYMQEHPIFEYAAAFSLWVDAVVRRSPQIFETEAEIRREKGLSAFEFPDLTWTDVSLPEDEDILRRMAGYFEGVECDEPTDLIRSKLRLLPVQQAINAQIAATTPFYPERFGSATRYTCSGCGHTGRFSIPDGEKPGEEAPDEYVTGCHVCDKDGLIPHYRADLESDQRVETVAVLGQSA